MANASFLIIEHINFAVAMTLNCIATYLIFTKSKKEINQYRKLLVIFLICGFFFALLHLIIRPTAVIRENMIVVYGTGWNTDMRLICCYCGVVSMSFLILAMHFVYRAMIISSKTHLVIEIGPRTIIKIVLVLLIEFVVWTILCVVYLCYKEEYSPTIARLTADLDDFPKENLECRLMMFLGTVDDKLNLPPLLAILSMISICGISILLIILSSIRLVFVNYNLIMRFLNDKQQRSSTWRRHNYQLFVALYVQFSGPLVLLYIPCMGYLLLPFIPHHGFSSPRWLLSLLYSIYPIVDPLVMIVFIRDYRRGLHNLLRKALCMSAQSSSHVISVHSQPTETNAASNQNK